MKPMLTSSFRQKVLMIDANDLPKYLQIGYEQHMPDAIPGGMISTEKLVRDYVAYHLWLEQPTTSNRNGRLLRLSNNDSESLSAAGGLTILKKLRKSRSPPQASVAARKPDIIL